MDDQLKLLQSYLPPELTKIAPVEAIIAVVLVMLTTVLFIGFKLITKGKKGTQLVLAGPCNGGKTTLFFQLSPSSSAVSTVASMSENHVLCSFTDDKGRKTAAVKLVDIPGHHSSRHRLEKHLDDALAVVFVLDATDMSPQKTEAADLLYEVLYHPAVAKKKIPILIACNKSDLEEQAFTVKFIRSTLEKQLETMHKTKTARIGKDLAKHGTGGADKIFSFDALRNKIAFAKISASKPDLKELHSFIAPLI